MQNSLMKCVIIGVYVVHCRISIVANTISGFQIQSASHCANRYEFTEKLEVEVKNICQNIYVKTSDNIFCCCQNSFYECHLSVTIKLRMNATISYNEMRPIRKM